MKSTLTKRRRARSTRTLLKREFWLRAGSSEKRRGPPSFVDCDGALAPLYRYDGCARGAAFVSCEIPLNEQTAADAYSAAERNADQGVTNLGLACTPRDFLTNMQVSSMDNKTRNKLSVRGAALLILCGLARYCFDFLYRGGRARASGDRSNNFHASAADTDQKPQCDKFLDTRQITVPSRNEHEL